jgi:dTDP-4-dehydrorhamnose reductase
LAEQGRRLVGGHAACDLTDAEQALRVIRAIRPDLLIHAQACSDVDLCERQPQLARAMNVQAVANVVRALEPLSAGLIHLSTDYVFDGTKRGPYDERDEPRPASTYGRSKLDGEREALKHPRAIVVRTSTLFGSARMNFCDHIVARVREGQPVEAFSDQRTSPTYTEDLAEGLSALALAWKSGPPADRPAVLHMTNGGGCTRVEFAHRVVDLLGADRALVRAIAMAAQHRPALRPANSSLTSIHLTRVIGRTLRPWHEALEAYLRQRHWLP